MHLRFKHLVQLGVTSWLHRHILPDCRNVFWKVCFFLYFWLAVSTSTPLVRTCSLIPSLSSNASIVGALSPNFCFIPSYQFLYAMASASICACSTVSALIWTVYGHLPSFALQIPILPSVLIWYFDMISPLSINYIIYLWNISKKSGFNFLL